MDIVARTGAGDLDLTLTIADPDVVTIGDVVGVLAGVSGLAEAVADLAPIGEAGPRVVDIDGRAIEAATTVAESGLVHGSVLSLGAPSTLTGDPDPGGDVAGEVAGDVEIAVVGGLCAGHDAPVGSELLVGRSGDCDLVLDDPAVSPRHAHLQVGHTVVVENLGSHNGVLVDGAPVHRTGGFPLGCLVELGATQVRLRARAEDDRPFGLDATCAATAGAMPFNRPPRVMEADPVRDVAVPDPPAERRRGAGFTLAAVLGPVVMGVVMVQLLGSIRYALFALMAPVMMIGNAIATRRRNTKAHRTSQREFRHALVELESALAAAADAERARRERALPDLAEIRRRARAPSARLWERRTHHPDHLRLRVGLGPVPWEPPVDAGRARAHPDLAATVAAAGVIDRCPVDLDLAVDPVVGIVGVRSAALAVARSLVVQAAVLHGPSDLVLIVLTCEGTAGAWDWVKWLPHGRAVGGGRLLARSPDGAAELMEQLVRAHAEADDRRSGRGPGMAASPPRVLLVVDDEALTIGSGSPVRSVLSGAAGPVAAIVLAASADRLPSTCAAVVDLRDDLGDAVVARPGRGRRIADVVAAGLPAVLARDIARRLARWQDPELPAASTGLPATARLLPLLDLDTVSAPQVAHRWAGRASLSLAVPIGVGPDGPLRVDLVGDGPHALVGGTTGSGKSELLRSWVAALGATYSPDDVTFVLVDYKGGAAFAVCAELPHTVGMVTDLDGHLGERALRSLEAELRHREAVLADAGAADLPAYVEAGRPLGPLPRLLVVVDEFATLAAELPDFLGALVGVAQRGRSLGIHLVLATQRPAGVVSADIKANTAIRVALRVQDPHESADIIDGPDAARIPRNLPGRAFIRLGPGEVVPVQVATSSTAGDRMPAVTVRPFRFGPGPSTTSMPSDGSTDLERLVSACVQAWHADGAAPPRRPWLPMPASSISLSDLCAAAAVSGSSNGLPGVAIGVADDPDHQRHALVRWDRGAGHLGLFGAPGSGTTTALATAVLAAARSATAERLHVHVVDLGDGGLTPLRALPHVGSVIDPGERERQARLLCMLDDEIEARRAAVGHDPADVVVAIDGLASLVRSFDDIEGQDSLDRLRRVLADGPAVGITSVFTADRPGAVPARLSGPVGRRLLFRPVDPADVGAAGVRAADLPAFIPGRAVDAASGLVVQIAHEPDIEAAVATVPAGARSAPAVEVLPEVVPWRLVTGTAEGPTPWSVPIGLVDRDRSPATIDLRPGQPVLVAGPAASGVSTALGLVGRHVVAASPSTVRVAVVAEDSPLRADVEAYDGMGTLGQLETVLRVAGRGDGREWLIVVDDAHLIDEPGPLLDVLGPATGCRVVVGGRSDQLHGQFGHWTRLVRRSGSGILVQPRLDIDGDLLSVRLPRRVSVPMVPGRGFIVSRGVATLVQVALPIGHVA